MTQAEKHENEIHRLSKSYKSVLTARVVVNDPGLTHFSGRVSDSGERRWTINAAIDESVPIPMLSAALYQRFGSRGEGAFADKAQSAMRYQFEGHEEQAGRKGE